MRGIRQKNNKNKTNKKRNNRSRLQRDWSDNTLMLCTCDKYIAAASVSTSAGAYTLEDSAMLATTGQFANFPQVFQPYMAGLPGNSVFDFTGRIKYRKLEVLLNFLGSQSNAIVAGDLYNRIRLCVVWSKSPYLTAPTVNALTLDTLLDRRDLDLVFIDEVINLPSTAFDAVISTNVPNCKTVKRTFDLNILPEHQVYSTGGGATWNSRSGTFRLYVVSDSSVAPNPIISGQTRLYYDILDS